MRTERHDLEAIQTARKIITLYDKQYFCETKKAYEIWQDDPLLRLISIPKNRVHWELKKKSKCWIAI